MVVNTISVLEMLVLEVLEVVVMEAIQLIQFLQVQLIQVAVAVAGLVMLLLSKTLVAVVELGATSPATAVEEVLSQRLSLSQRVLENDFFHVLGIDPAPHHCRSFLSWLLNLHAHSAVEEVEMVSLAAVPLSLSL